MACSGAESFRADVLIDYGDGQVLSGCYAYYGQVESTSLLPIYSIGGGNETGQPAIFAYNSSSLGHAVWTFGRWVNGGRLQNEWYCEDANWEDARLLAHPTNVRQWDCWNDVDQARTNEDYVSTTCGCTATPSPTSPSTSSTSISSSDGAGTPEDSCSRNDSFLAGVFIDYGDGEVLNGCYENSGEESSQLPIFTVGGVDEAGQPAIFASYSSTFGHSVWNFGMWTTGGALIVWYCMDANAGDAHELGHPTSVSQWDCWDEDDQAHTNANYATTRCGCEGTPSPTAPLTPSPVTPLTPAPNNLGTLAPTTSSFISSNEGAGCLDYWPLAKQRQPERRVLHRRLFGQCT
ncbi:unnamed protein product [Ectocarpus sp. 6 AP-2014]